MHGCCYCLEKKQKIMTFIPIKNAGERLRNIKMIATDMDGTITQSGKFTSNLLQALERLKQKNIAVLIVTGRSAGWVDGVRNYLPVTGAFAENGGVLFYERETPEILTPISDLNHHRQQLAKTFNFLKNKFPLLQITADNQFRLTDWTFDIKNLTNGELRELGKLCEDQGWGFTYSTVQCHIKPKKQDKATALKQVLKKYFPKISTEQIITVGDSPNDETMFDTNKFPLSVGVANILEYRDQLNHQPVYLTTASGGEGFCELVSLMT